MQIPVNTDENVEGGEGLSARVSPEIHTRLDRYGQHITRMKVHLSDESGGKSGGADKRCLIEVRLEGCQPEVASGQAATLESAYSGDVNKLYHALKAIFDRLNRVKGTDTIRTGIS